MKKELVIDSCVFAKLFLVESDSEVAFKFFSKVIEKGFTIYAPELFIYEILNICAINKLSEEKIFEMLNGYKKCGLKIVSLTDETLLEALKMAKIGHPKSGYPSFYDRSYHALAIKEKCVFVTSDVRHPSRAKKYGHVKLLTEMKLDE